MLLAETVEGWRRSRWWPAQPCWARLGLASQRAISVWHISALLNTSLNTEFSYLLSIILAVCVIIQSSIFWIIWLVGVETGMSEQQSSISLQIMWGSNFVAMTVWHVPATRTVLNEIVEAYLLIAFDTAYLVSAEPPWLAKYTAIWCSLHHNPNRSITTSLLNQYK